MNKRWKGHLMKRFFLLLWFKLVRVYYRYQTDTDRSTTIDGVTYRYRWEPPWSAIDKVIGRGNGKVKVFERLK